MRFPVQVTSVSAEGAGLALLAPAGTSLGDSRELVQVFLELGGGVAMPAQVVRFRSTSDRSGLYEVGLRLRPELAPASNRLTYASWIADKIEALASSADRRALELVPEPTGGGDADASAAESVGDADDDDSDPAHDDADVDIEVTLGGAESHAAFG